MKNLILIACIAFAVSVNAQRVEKELYDYGIRTHYEYQVNNKTGEKNGYYKEYNEDGTLYETGTYKNGKQEGAWTKYFLKGYGIYISSNYIDGKLNGEYKVYEVSRQTMTRYLFQDQVYKDGILMKSKAYNSAGRLTSEFDREKNIDIEWFADGSPSKETKRGKLYKYEENDNGSRRIDRITFDSIGNKIEYFFNSGILALITLSDSNDNPIERFSYTGNQACGLNYEIWDKQNRKEVKLDSANVRKIILWGRLANRTAKIEIKDNYDEAKGDFKSDGGSGVFELVHYYPSNSPFQYKKVYLEDGKIITEEFYICNYDEYNRMLFQIKKRITREYYPNGTPMFEAYENNVPDKDVPWGVRENSVINDSIKEYFKTGSIAYKRAGGKQQWYYNSGKLEKETGWKASFSDPYPCCYLREYYESGKLKLNVVLFDEFANGKVDEEDFNLPSVSKVLYYDENGKLRKVIRYRSGYGHYCDTISGYRQIDIYLMTNSQEEFFKVCRGPMINNSYSYPKGFSVYEKSSVVLDEISKRFNKAKNAEVSDQLASEYITTVEKLLNQFTGDTNLLNEQLSKVKKIDDIKFILGI